VRAPQCQRCAMLLRATCHDTVEPLRMLLLARADLHGRETKPAVRHAHAAQRFVPMLYCSYVLQST